MEEEKYQGYVEREITVKLPCKTMIGVAKYLESDESLLLPDAVDDVLQVLVDTYFKEAK